MSTIAYSIDLKSRVIEHIKSGNSQKSTSQIFKVSTSAINRWWIRYKVEGVFTSKARQGSKGKVNAESLKNFVQDNGDKTLLDIGNYFGVSACSIYRRLKKLGFSYKKNL